MAFFDKLSDIAKNLGEKASEMVETTKQKTSDVVEGGKLSAKIKTEQENIDEMHRQIGLHYENNHAGKHQSDPEMQKLMEAVEKSRAAIAEYQDALDKMKTEEEARKAAKAEAQKAAEAAAAAAAAAKAAAQATAAADAAAAQETETTEPVEHSVEHSVEEIEPSPSEEPGAQEIDKTEEGQDHHSES